MIKPATAWYRFEDDQWKYNHFEYGISPDPKPTPQSDRQQVWAKMRWGKKYGYYQNALGKSELVTETEMML